MTSSATQKIKEELSHDSPSILNVRRICKENPGLIDSSGLRCSVWCLLLLGTSDTSIVEGDVFNPNEDQSCMEQQVLDADLKRTRAELENFRTEIWQNRLRCTMQHFCVTHGVQYKQGMNEICAPFIWLQPPPSCGSVSFALFEAFLFRYLERYFCLDDSSFLFKAFRLFHILLVYHDPELALFLQNKEIPPELYAPQWFLTVYSRALPLTHVLHLWDMVVAVDDPAFIFYIGLALMCRYRDKLLSCAPERIP